MTEMLQKRIYELGLKVKDKEMKWKEVAEIVNKEFNMTLNNDSIRQRFNRIQPKFEAPAKLNTSFTLNGDGVICAEDIVCLSTEEKSDPNKILIALGFDPTQIKLITLTASLWDQHTKEQDTKHLYAVKYKIAPIKKEEISLEDAINAAKEAFKGKIKPLKYLPNKISKDENDENKLIEFPGFELHLGKFAIKEDSGEDYNKDICAEIFKKAHTDLLSIQAEVKAGTLLLMLGNDFFNTDTTTYTTTKGTGQMNDLKWKQMFLIGLDLYKKLISDCAQVFDNVEIRLQSGNHDKMSSFYLYIALLEKFGEIENINFGTDYKDVQTYIFGNNLIAYSHGESNLKRLTRSIAAEFPEEWGKTKYRELHLGHLHKEVVVDDEGGLIVRRVTSPTATDTWHYGERYIGATRRSQLFIWDKETGLDSIEYLSIDGIEGEDVNGKTSTRGYTK